LLYRAILPCPVLPCVTGQGRAGMNFIYMPFFPPGQDRTGQGIRAGQVEKKCPVDISGV